MALKEPEHTLHAVKQLHALLGAVALATLCLAACASPGTEAPGTSDTPLGTAATLSPDPLDEIGVPTPTSAPRSSQRRGGGFVPLDDPSFIPASRAAFLGDDELVLGYDQDGEARAYPVSMMFWHHIVNDTVQGRPFLATY